MSKKVVTLISTDNVLTCHGLRSIPSLLKKHGHKTRLIFLPSLKRRYEGKTLSSLKELVSDSDLIGITCYSQTLSKAVQVIGFFKETKLPLVWGGCHATLNPEQCIQLVDFVCVGEGEWSCLNLVDNLDNRDAIKTIPNLWVKQRGRYIKIS